MKSNRSLIVIIGFALFALFLALAVVLQSAYLLYAASLLPVVIVPFLPDIRSNQWIKPSGKRGADMYLLKLQGASHAEFLVLEFAPGALQWSKHRLYFPVTESKYPVFNDFKSSSAASLSVLPFDLAAHPRKAGWFRIELKHLLGRTASFSFTHEEVGRLVVRLDDLRTASSGYNAAASNVSKDKRQSPSF